VRTTILLALAALAVAAAGCGASSSDRSSQIAAEIGSGASCTATRYAVIRRAEHTKTRIYDCDSAGKRMCVTEENGIASDQTALVRILFANALSGGKPGCLAG
jgi:hypothetical protein